MDTIQAVECYDCVLELPRQLQVGSSTVSQRSYAIVRVRTASGLDGVGYAYGRGLPVARVVSEALAPILVGQDATTPECTRSNLYNAYWPYGDHGIFQVAMSVIDLALWDILGKRFGASLADMLGRRRNSVRLCAVAGYTAVGADDLASLQAEVTDIKQRGFQSIKITIGAASPAHDAARVAAVREIVGDACYLVADAFCSFVDLDDAVRRLHALEPYQLSFIEDPFPVRLAPLIADLRHRTGVRIGLGENLNGHHAYRDVIAAQCVDVVRCDATVIGGVREFMAAAAMASAYGLPVFAHVHPDVHIHFAAALSNLYEGGLEYMLPDSGIDPFYQLLTSGLEVHDGYADVPNRPGLGLDIDWALVKQCARD